MDTIFNVVIAVVVIGFIIFILMKFGKKSGGINTTAGSGNTGSSAGTSYKNQMPELASFLGLSHQDVAPPADSKTFMNTGDRIYGTYRGVEIEILMAAFARQSDHTPLTATFAYDYSSTKYFAFKVNNTGGKYFNVFPKNKNQISTPTGSAAFDASLSLTGNFGIPAKYLDYFGKLGWMDLSMKNNAVVMNDSFYEHITNTRGGMAMMSAVHPVWNTSAKNFQVDLNNVKSFIDTIVDFIEETGLKA